MNNQPIPKLKKKAFETALKENKFNNTRLDNISISKIGDYLLDNSNFFDEKANEETFKLDLQRMSTAEIYQTYPEFLTRFKIILKILSIDDIDQFMIYHNNAIFLRESICEYAIVVDRLDILEWAREKEYPWKNPILCTTAVNNNNLNILQWLRNRNPDGSVLDDNREINNDICPWNSSVCIAAITHEYFDILKWILENGDYNLTSNDLSYFMMQARQMNKPNILKYLKNIWKDKNYTDQQNILRDIYQNQNQYGGQSINQSKYVIESIILITIIIVTSFL